MAFRAGPKKIDQEISLTSEEVHQYKVSTIRAAFPYLNYNGQQRQLNEILQYQDAMPFIRFMKRAIILDDAPWTWQHSWNRDMPEFFQGIPHLHVLNYRVKRTHCTWVGIRKLLLELLCLVDV